MSNDFYFPLKGHFTIETLDAKTSKVLDTFSDDNMIVYNARLSMAEIFANLEGIKFAHKVVFGTCGCYDGNLYKARDESDGLNKNRDRLFSEVAPGAYTIGNTIEQLLKYDLLSITVNGDTNIYRYEGDTAENYIISEANLASEWTVQESAPYTYTINFSLPRTNDFSSDANFAIVDDSEAENETISLYTNQREEFNVETSQNQFITQYDIEEPLVYLNGILQSKTTYTYEDNTLTLNSAASAGDVVVILYNTYVDVNSDDSEYASSIDVAQVVQTDTSVTFTFRIAEENGNEQITDNDEYDLDTTFINEAGLYVNDRLFAMKTFSSKAKDESVVLRVIWTITF